MNTPRELTEAEERELEQFLAEEHEKWLAEQSWLEYEQTMEPAWSINDYEALFIDDEN